MEATNKWRKNAYGISDPLINEALDNFQKRRIKGVLDQ